MIYLIRTDLISQTSQYDSRLVFHQIVPRIKRPSVNNSQCELSVCSCACPHLKLGPVHAHARPVGVPPPSEVLSVAGSLDGLTKVPVQVFEAGEQRDTSLHHIYISSFVHLCVQQHLSKARFTLASEANLKWSLEKLQKRCESDTFIHLFFRKSAKQRGAAAFVVTSTASAPGGEVGVNTAVEMEIAL